MPLNNEDLDLLRRVAKTPDGKALVLILEKKLRERDEKLRTATGEELYRAQGRAQELAELLSDIAEADTRLKRATPPVRVQWKDPGRAVM